MVLTSNLRFAGLAFVVWLAQCLVVSADEYFRETVASVLQTRCLGCHNDRDQKGGYSLQTAQAALDGGYIEVGDANASYWFELISRKDSAGRMPKDRDALPVEEVEILRTWINSGAEWPTDLALEPARVQDFDWWSYRPVSMPAVPASTDPWVQTPIDAFVLEQLNREGLRHSATASRETLIRRLYYDLIGLPPTPQEVSSFVHETSATAYAELVDRLLDSPHYGERWATHWLDVVKYADTCGYDKDKLRPNAWPYRDYVIRSFNEDKPYGQFVQEQVAGDVLFPNTADGIAGLGFIAAGPWDFIGHVEVPESKIDGRVARNLDRDDMVSNVMNTFCSVTVQCARCHNHKFDPITQEHYYGMQAVFAAVDRAERPYDLDPQVEAKRQHFTERLKALREETQVLKQEMVELGGGRLAELNQQVERVNKELEIKKSAQFGYHSSIADLPNTTKWIELDFGEPVDVSEVILWPCHDEYAGIGAGFGFPVRFKVEALQEGDDWLTLSDQTQRDFRNPGLLPFRINQVDLRMRRLRITATRLAVRKDDYHLALAEVQVMDRDGRNWAGKSTASALDSIEAAPRWSIHNLTDLKWPYVEDSKLADELAQLTSERSRILETVETEARVVRRDKLENEILGTESDLERLPKGKVVYAAATHFAAQGNFKPTQGALRPIHVLNRGEVEQLGVRAVPGVLPLSATYEWQLDDRLSESARRAALAKWLTDSEHPLVWRSIVNRIWQYHFGVGLVATPNDFGRMGARPTHPELLDWLAATFRDQGQSLKGLHRMIVTSSTYRQASAYDEANATIDGSNLYLWRMNRRRLDAEEIRDSMLKVSGLLDRRMGGPGFYQFELEKPEHSPHFEYHKFDPSDSSTHRRSVYRFMVRSQPDPWMTTLDCADSSQSTPRRVETVTSLQALALLNNKFNLFAAKSFAEQVASEFRELETQVDQAFFLVTQRPIEPAEREVLVDYAEAHGLENLCRMMFNLSEFVYLD